MNAENLFFNELNCSKLTHARMKDYYKAHTVTVLYLSVIPTEQRGH